MSEPLISMVEAKVYKTPERRYFTLKGAIASLARMAARNKGDKDCECNDGDPEIGMGPEICRWHSALDTFSEDHKILKRYQRMLNLKVRRDLRNRKP